MDSLIKGPSKRDVAGMKAAFGQVQAGEVISVLFKTHRFANFLITGTAHITGLGDLMVGGLSAAAAAKPGKDPAGGSVAQRQPDKDVRAYPVEPAGDFDPQDVQVAQLRHGDLVVASFSQAPYGDFVVTGVITQAQNDAAYLMVGPWIISTADGQAPRLTEVKLVAAAGTHVAPVPAQRGLVDLAELKG